MADEADTTISDEMKRAIAPFVACMEYIAGDESDEEWAKFRLLVKDYRRLASLSGMTTEEARVLAGHE